MPVYLLHGFKWPRPLIRIHIILQNLDDAAAEWLVSRGTTACMLDNFHTLFPDQMKHLPKLRFVEQFDPTDESTANNAPSQPFAYVADICEEVKLGIDIDELRGRGVSGNQWSALVELRDKIAPEERPGWFVVVCGDEERWAPPTMEALQQAGQHNGVRRAESETESELFSHRPSWEVGIMRADRPSIANNRQRPNTAKDVEPRGFKKLFGGFARRKSQSSISAPPQIKQQPPPLPSPPKSSDKAPQLPVSPRRNPQPSPSIITNDNLVTEKYGNARTVNATPAGGNEPGSISPIEEEPCSTPGTAYLVSSMRVQHGSADLLSHSRVVRPVEMRRISRQVDCLRSVSPTAVRSSDPLARQQRPDAILDVMARTDRSPLSPQLPHMQLENSGRKRRPLEKPQTWSLACRHSLMTTIEVAGNDEERDYGVVTMATRSPTPMLTRQSSKDRRSSVSPIKVRASPDTYRPKTGSSHFDHSGRPRRDSKGEDAVFGQKLNQFDLVAKNIESALNGMR